MKFLRDTPKPPPSADLCDLSFAHIFCLSVNHEAVLAVCTPSTSTDTDKASAWLLESGKHHPIPVPVQFDGAIELHSAEKNSDVGSALLMGGTLMWQPSSTSPWCWLARFYDVTATAIDVQIHKDAHAVLM